MNTAPEIFIILDVYSMHTIPQGANRVCAYQGVRNVCFLEILVCFAFLKYPF